MSLLSASLLLLLVFDPLGNMPVFMSYLRIVPPERRRRVVVREMLIALTILLIFLAGGQYILTALRIEGPSLTIAGGVILFLIALRMIFPATKMPEEELQQEPLIVPLAVPLVAGPSAMATILLLTSRWPQQRLDWLLALLIAWGLSALLLVLTPTLSDLLGERVLRAVERLMGMILVAVAVQMALDGVTEFILRLDSLPADPTIAVQAALGPRCAPPG
jgi:multiple antibiotic resistance protein